MSAQVNFLQEIPGYSFKLTPGQVKGIYKLNPQLENVFLTIELKKFPLLCGKKIISLVNKWKNVEISFRKSDKSVGVDIEGINKPILPFKKQVDLIFKAVQKYRAFYHVEVKGNEYSLSNENNRWELTAYASSNEKKFLLFAKKLGLENLAQVKKRLWPQPEKYVKEKPVSQTAFYKWLKSLPEPIGNITVASSLSSVEQKKIIDLLIPKMPRRIVIDMKGNETVFHIYEDCVSGYEILLPFLGASPKIDVGFTVKEKIAGKTQRVILNEDNIRATWGKNVLRIESSLAEEKFGGFSYNYKKVADDLYNNLSNLR